MTLPVGTVLTKFRNTFMLTDPWYIKGLELWRQVLTEQLPEGSLGITSLLPIITIDDGFNNRVNVRFSTNSLLSVFDNPDTQLPKNKAHSILQGDLSAIHQSTNISKVATEAPIQLVSQEDTEVLYFDIVSLSKLDIVDSVETTNSNLNVAGVSSELPMVATTSDDIVTFSFNVLNLSPV